MLGFPMNGQGSEPPFPKLDFPRFLINHFLDQKILVSGNAGDEKNLHPGGRKFIIF